MVDADLLCHGLPSMRATGSCPHATLLSGAPACTGNRTQRPPLDGGNNGAAVMNLGDECLGSHQRTSVARRLSGCSHGATRFPPTRWMTCRYADLIQA
ncbi:hypothetical protein MRX96_050417 [Rhipicephalus microplus]